jgi:hypothetical protein
VRVILERVRAILERVRAVLERMHASLERACSYFSFNIIHKEVKLCW